MLGKKEIPPQSFEQRECEGLLIQLDNALRKAERLETILDSLNWSVNLLRDTLSDIIANRHR